MRLQKVDPRARKDAMTMTKKVTPGHKKVTPGHKKVPPGHKKVPRGGRFDSQCSKKTHSEGKGKKNNINSPSAKQETRS